MWLKMKSYSFAGIILTFITMRDIKSVNTSFISYDSTIHYNKGKKYIPLNLMIYLLTKMAKYNIGMKSVNHAVL